MKFEATPLQGAYLLKPRVFGDARGFFLESWNAATFSDAGFDLNFVPKTAQESRISFAINNSFGFGGHNTSTVFGRFNG